MSRSRSGKRRRKKQVTRAHKPADKGCTFAKEALWSTLSAGTLIVGIVAYAVWSFRVHGYAHVYLSVILIALLTTIIAAMFVNLWWSQRRKRQRAPGPRRRHH